MQQSDNPGSSRPSARATAKSSGNKRKREPAALLGELTPEEKKRRELITNSHKANQNLMTTYHKIHRELSNIDVIEAHLKAKPWDTTAQRKYLRTARGGRGSLP